MREWLGLKSILRTGWVRAGVKSPESVAAHSWGMSVLAMHLCPPELDRMRVLEMCLVHDLPEVEVGDLTPHDDTSSKIEIISFFSSRYNQIQKVGYICFD